MNPLEVSLCDSTVTFDLRHDIRPGDLGDLVALHGTVFARECGFDATFEAHVACRLGEFVHKQSELDRLWIAEWDGRLVGSIAIVSHSEKDAQLRWFLVDPSARSLGLGRILLDEAIAFCRQCCYEYVYLHTVRSLTVASHLFRSVGFETVEERPSERWGVSAIEEWYVLYPFREENRRRQAHARISL
jgi:N-acetylglutamate synthase-like GNAT family acetyltransferase